MTHNISPTFPLEAEDKTRGLYRNWREGFATPLLIGSLVFGLLALIPAVSAAKNNIISLIFISMYILAGIVAFIPFPYEIRMGTFLLILYILGLSELATHGILGDSLFFFLGVIIFSTMMFSPAAGLATIAIDLLTFLVFGWLMLGGIFIPLNPQAPPATLQDWLSAGGVILMSGVVIILGFRRLELEVNASQKQVDATLMQLTDERTNLERVVQERTGQLRRLNDIGRTLTAVLDPDELLSGGVFLIGNEFDCYFTAIYLIDPYDQWAELREATGEAGKVLRENRHKVDLSGKSAVAGAIRKKQIQIVRGSEAEPLQSENPLLPYTKSLMIIPLMVGERVIGALELHSTKEGIFSGQNVDTYNNMANQMAIALENSRLFQEASQSLAEMRAIQRQYLQETWSSLASEKPMEYELGEGKSPGNPLEIPLTLRDKTIGQIDLSTIDEWTPEQRSLVETIANQAALALENARLVEESQSIAAREKLANEIISKVWSSPTIDSILQTTIRELGRALEAAEVNIELRMGERYE